MWLAGPRRCLKVFKVMSFQYRINTNHSIYIIHLFSLSLCCNIVLMYKTADYHITFCHCMWVIRHPLQHVSPQWQLDNDPKVNLTGHQQPHSPLSHCTPSTVESIAYYYLHEVKLTATQWFILTAKLQWQIHFICFTKCRKSVLGRPILNAHSFTFVRSAPAFNLTLTNTDKQ